MTQVTQDQRDQIEETKWSEYFDALDAFGEATQRYCSKQMTSLERATIVALATTIGTLLICFIYLSLAR